MLLTVSLQAAIPTVAACGTHPCVPLRGSQVWFGAVMGCCGAQHSACPLLRQAAGATGEFLAGFSRALMWAVGQGSRLLMGDGESCRQLKPRRLYASLP